MTTKIWNDLEGNGKVEVSPMSLRCTMLWKYSQTQVNLGTSRSDQYQAPNKSLLYAMDRKGCAWVQGRSLRCGGEKKIRCSCWIRNSEEGTGNWWLSGIIPAFQCRDWERQRKLWSGQLTYYWDLNHWRPEHAVGIFTILLWSVGYWGTWPAVNTGKGP
jgi:hypothetical protein